MSPRYLSRTSALQLNWKMWTARVWGLQSWSSSGTGAINSEGKMVVVANGELRDVVSPEALGECDAQIFVYMPAYGPSTSQ